MFLCVPISPPTHYNSNPFYNLHPTLVFQSYFTFCFSWTSYSPLLHNHVFTSSPSSNTHFSTNIFTSSHQYHWTPISPSQRYIFTFFTFGDKCLFYHFSSWKTQHLICLSQKDVRTGCASELWVPYATLGPWMLAGELSSSQLQLMSYCLVTWNIGSVFFMWQENTKFEKKKIGVNWAVAGSWLARHLITVPCMNVDDVG